MILGLEKANKELQWQTIKCPIECHLNSVVILWLFKNSSWNNGYIFRNKVLGYFSNTIEKSHSIFKMPVSLNKH